MYPRIRTVPFFALCWFLVWLTVWAAMGTVLNSDTDHAEMLAIHLDTILRGRMGTLSELEIEELIKACMQLLRFMVVRGPGRAGAGRGTLDRLEPGAQ
jgi:hypothetical protein